MRVSSNSFPNNLVGHLSRLTERMNTLQQQAATGQRINRASDDPAAATRVLNYQSDRGKIAQYQRNALHAEDIINASTAEVQNLLKVSDRGSEIATLVSDVLGPDAIRTYGVEINALLEQAVVNANASFNGEPLFGGTTGNLQPYTATRDANGTITSVTYNGAASVAQVQVADGSSISPYSSIPENQQILGFLNTIVGLRDALATGTADAVKLQGTALRASENDLINQLSGKGALGARLEVDKAQNAARFTDLAEQISRDADVDLAQTIVQLTQNQNAYQAALQSAGKILDRSLLDYI